MPSTTSDDHIAELVRRNGRSRTVTFIPEPGHEQLFCPVISVDDHTLEPPDIFQGRTAAKFHDRVPRVITGDDGAPWWVIEDSLVPILMLNGASGRVLEEWQEVASDYSEMRRGTWDSTARLHDMDITGVWASLCFPSSIWGFAGKRFSAMGDQELGLACVRAYNDWLLEEWCGAAPDRYIPCQLPWLADAQIAADEIHRNAERGFRAVSFSENPEGLGFPNIYDRVWDPFLRACEETQTVVNLHVGSSGTVRRPCSSSVGPVGTVLFPVNGMEALADWIYAGIPLRFPDITIALSEAGISWVPMLLERFERAYRQAKSEKGKSWPAGAPSPVEFVRRNFVFTSIEDPSGFRNLDLIGEDRVMVETDYPHFDSTWPDSQATIRYQLQDLAPSTIRKVCYENAARIYRHPLPPDELIAASQVGTAAGMAAEAR